jgi:hypothetical protein
MTFGPQSTIRTKLTSSQSWILFCGRLFRLTDGQAAFHSNGKLSRRFVRFDSYHDPGARQDDWLNDQLTLHCDGELKRSATRNRASGFQKQAAKTDVLGDGNSRRHDALQWEHDVGKVLEFETTKFSF